MALTIASLNVRGLRDNTKRREVFNWLRKKNYSAYMLQEVHCPENTNYVWSAEWGYQAIFSTYKSNKAGVYILFNNNFDFQIEKTYTDPQGWASDFFEIQKGVRQGCPPSPYLFVLAVEVLAKAIRENKSIKGIFVNVKK